MTMFLSNAKRILVFLSLLMCAACTDASSTSPLQLTAYNHTSESVGSFSVEIPGGSGSGSGFLGSGEGGGGFVCCVSVPTKWRPGMSISVTWNMVVNDKEETITRTVLIPEYRADDSTRLSVHFLASGGVRAFVTPYALRHQNYPFKGKDAVMPPMKSL